GARSGSSSFRRTLFASVIRTVTGTRYVPAQSTASHCTMQRKHEPGLVLIYIGLFLSSVRALHTCNVPSLSSFRVSPSYRQSSSARPSSTFHPRQGNRLRPPTADAGVRVCG